MERILSKQDFDRAVEGGLGRDRWFPLDEIGKTWGSCGNVFHSTADHVGKFAYCGEGIVVCGTALNVNLAKVSRSIDYGATWRNLGHVAALGESYLVGIEYLGGGVVVAGTMFGGHIVRSEDYGAGWSDLGAVAGGDSIVDILSLGSGWAVAVSGGNRKIIRTVDYGVTWTDLGSIGGAGWLRGASYLGKGTVVACGDGPRIYRSEDYGLTWQDITGQFPGATAAGYPPCSLGDGVALFAPAGDDILWRTEDRGATWKQQGKIAGAKGIGPIEYCGNGVVLAAHTGTGLAKSTDYGWEWEQLLPIPVTTIDSMKYLERGIVLVGGRGGVVYRSESRWFLA